MKNKTCGECRFFESKEFICCHSGDDTEAHFIACLEFEPIPKPTNGDVIRQMSNEELAELIDNSCKACAKDVTECDTECVNGILAWLNAPAESQLNDAIQNVIKDGAKTAIDIHEAAYAPDMNDGTMIESEGKNE